MRLDRLTAAELSGAAAATEITALAYDSRSVTPGTLFFCVPGFRSDGHEFAAQAVERGRGRARRRAPAGPRRARAARGVGARGDGAAGGALLRRPGRASCAWSA